MFIIIPQKFLNNFTEHFLLKQNGDIYKNTLLD